MLFNVTHERKGISKFLTWFYGHLLLLKRYVYSSLKKYCLLNLKPAEVRTEQIFDIIFGEDSLINEYFDRKFNYVFIDLSNVK